MKKLKKNTTKKPKSKNQRKMKKRSIKQMLIISYVICAVIPLVLVNAFSSSQSKTTLKKTSSELAVEMVKQIADNVGYYTETFESTISRIIINDLNASTSNLMYQYVITSRKQETPAEKIAYYNLRENITSQLNYSITLDEAIADIALIFDDGVQVGSTKDFSRVDVEEFNRNPVIREAKWYCIDNNGTMEIYVLKRVGNTKSGSTMGTLIAQVDMKILQSKISNINLFEGSKVSIVDDKGQVLCATSEEPIDEAILAHINFEDMIQTEEVKGELVTYVKGTNNWTIIAQIPQKMLTYRIDEVAKIVWLVILAVAAIAVLMGSLMSKGIVTSVKQLRALMKEAEKGDLTVVASIKGNDEIAELGESFNHMMENIKRLLKEAKHTVEHSLSAGSTLKNSSQISMESIGQLALSISHIADGSNSQAEDIQNGAMVMEHLSQSIQEVIEETQILVKHNEGTKQMVEVANDNIKELNQTVVATSKISVEMNQSISELSILTKTIGEVMKLLDEISERTNLLALNASIEAARAGAAGNGFAVVANEVRNLANQSKASSTKVKEALKDIERKVGDTSSLVGKSNEVFEEQKKSVNKTYDSLNKMLEGIKEMNEELEQVNERVALMSSYKEDMNDRIQNISVVTQENAAAVEEVNALSEEQRSIMEEFASLASELMRNIEGLNQSVDTFIVEKNTATNNL